MFLHEFMSARRDEILATCQAELAGAQGREELKRYVEEFFDETLRAVRRDSGIRDSSSPLPEGSETAARFGAERQRAGLAVTDVPVLFSAISQALAKTGEKYELTISAEEYRILNRCLDAGVATSIENFWQEDKVRENQLITERFGFVAHELRNALGNATLAFKLLRSGNLDLNGRTADVVARNLARMDALVVQSLARVQLDVGVTPELTPVHVASVLRNVEASAIPDRGISLVLELDEHVFIAADEMLLASAVSNLVNNAIKFSPPGATVWLRGYTEQGRALIEVEDHGGGLKHENPAEIFKPYVKRKAGNSKGTGLGLAIAMSAVKAMNGDLGVVDEPGHGCLFTMAFPSLAR